MVRSSAAFLLGVLVALAAGWAAFPRVLYKQTDQPLQFSHKAHTGEKVGMGCSDCHVTTAEGRFAGLPRLENCAACHAEPVTDSEHEKVLVEQYVKPGREIPWLVYSRQPENVRFSHASHVNLGKVACERCHGDHGNTETLRPYEENRITGYSRDIWGSSISRISFGKTPARPGMKMDDCLACHKQEKVVTSCLSCHK